MPSNWPTFDVTRDTISALPVSLSPTLGLSGVHQNRHSLLGVTAHDLRESSADSSLVGTSLQQAKYGPFSNKGFNALLLLLAYLH